MKRLYFIALAFILVNRAKAQELAQVSFAQGTSLSYYSFVTDGNVLIRVGPEGLVREWGTEEQSLRNNNYYAPRLLPYTGRVEYYGPTADSVSRGKIKSIGSCNFTYYGAYEDAAKAGKLKMVGRNMLDYYSTYENKELKGLLKFIGSQQVAYYSSFDDAAYRGKIKSISNTTITYYSSFDDKAIRGKLKSIGPVTYSWYTSLDINKGPGGLKNGPLRQDIAGIVYILQY